MQGQPPKHRTSSSQIHVNKYRLMFCDINLKQFTCKNKHHKTSEQQKITISRDTHFADPMLSHGQRLFKYSSVCESQQPSVSTQAFFVLLCHQAKHEKLSKFLVVTACFSCSIPALNNQYYPNLRQPLY